MAELTFTKGRTWTIQWNTIYEGYSNLTYIGKWTREYYNDADYAAVAIEYDVQGIGSSIEPWSVTIPIAFSSNYKGSNLYAALSTVAPNTSSPNWRYGPTGGIIGSEITFGYKTTSLVFNVRTLTWLGSNKVYLYLYDHDNGTSAAVNRVVYSNADDASFTYNDAYTLTINEGQGSTIQITRQSSELESTGSITDGDLLYTNDSLRIAVSPNSNYRILTLTVNGNTFVSGNTHNVTGNVSVVSTAQVLSSDVGATDADIESNSTITIARYDSSYVHSLYYTFGSLSGYITASGSTSSSEVIITGTSVSFAVPSTFYAEIPNAKTGTCTITCRTYQSASSSEILGEPTTCTFTVRASETLCAPIVSGTVTDTNQTTLLLTGGSGDLVRYLSTALCTITATSRNGASIASKTIGGNTVSGNSVTISGDALTQQSIRFAATDSRGFTSYVDVAITLIPYTKLTCNPEISRTTPTGGGVSLSISGMFYNGNWRDGFPNVLRVRYRYKNAEDSVLPDNWRTISSGITTQTNGYRTQSPIALLDENGSATGFDYRNSYVFEFEATDGDGTNNCMTVTRQVTIQQGIPVFDWGKNDFRFNVPVYLGERPAASVPMGHVDSTSTATAFTATVDGITDLRDGVWCYLTNGVVTSAANCTLNINNLGAKPLYSSLAAATRSTTIFNINYTMLFIYNSTRVSGGCWDVFYGYDSNTNTIGYQLRRNNGTYLSKTAATRYQIMLSYSPTQVLPIYSGSYSTGTSKTLTTEDFDPFGPIWYYSTTTAVSAGDALAVGSMWEQYTLDLRYSFNTGSTLVNNSDVYIVAVPQTNGRAKLHSAPIAQSLPTSEDGLIYIYLGHAYSTSSIVLAKDHPIYCYRNGMIQQWTAVQSEIDAIKAQLAQLLSN